MISFHDDTARSRRTPLSDNDEACERTCAELRIYSGAIHPSEVTRRLRIDPTGQVVAGERGLPNSSGKAPLGKVNGWFLSSEGTVVSQDLRRHLDWLISKLDCVADELGELQNLPGVQMSVGCPWWAGFRGAAGPVLWPEQMAGLAKLNLECAISYSDYNETDS